MKFPRNLTVCAALAGLAAVTGCIPTAPEAAKPAPSAPAAAIPAANTPPAVTTRTVSEEGKVHSVLMVNTDARPNASIEVSPLPDGKGYALKGTFNLSGTLTPAAPGKWLLKAEYRMAEADFAAGAPMVTTLNEVSPGAGGVTVTENRQVVLIDLPVSPPAAAAPAGTPLRRVPVEAGLSASGDAVFNVFFTNMQR